MDKTIGGFHEKTSFRLHSFHHDGLLRRAALRVVVDAAWYMWLGSTQIYEIIPGFIAGLLAAWIISLLGKKPSEEVLSLFEKSRQPQD